MEAKEQARELIQSRLDLLTDQEFEEKSAAIYQNIKTVLLHFQNKQKIQAALLYQPITKWREIDISELENDFPGIRFDYAPQGAGSPLPVEFYGIIFVPLYGFNQDHFRLGHGGGWYDRLLAEQPHALKIGVGLEVNNAEFEPEPFDIPMNSIVTEIGVR